MLKVGDQVKVFIKLGLQREKIWQQGVIALIDDSGQRDRIMVKIAGQEIDVGEEPKGNVLRYESLSSEALEDWAKKELNVLFEMLTKAVKHFYGDKYKVNIFQRVVDISGIVEISAAAVESKSILGIKEFPGWACVTYKTLHATHWEPEDCQEVFLCESRSTPGIVQAAIQHFHNLVEINPYFEQLADEAYAKSLAEEKEDN